MGRPLSELAQTMTSEEFGLHLQLEIERNAPPPAPPDERSAYLGST